MAREEFEDEEKKREEEEQNKADEDAGANAGATADPIDDWGSFATVGKKAKKGKKGAEPEPPPPPPPPVEPIDLGASATADANPDDEWGGFSTGKKKKGAKKGKVRTSMVYSFDFELFERRSHANIELDVARDCSTYDRNPFLADLASQKSCFAVSYRNVQLDESRDYPHIPAGKEF